MNNFAGCDLLIRLNISTRLTSSQDYHPPIIHYTKGLVAINLLFEPNLLVNFWYFRYIRVGWGASKRSLATTPGWFQEISCNHPGVVLISAIFLLVIPTVTDGATIDASLGGTIQNCDQKHWWKFAYSANLW